MTVARCPGCGAWRVTIWADHKKRSMSTRRHEPCGIVTIPPSAETREI